MAKKEANFDLYIHDLLVEAGIQADTQGSNIVPINEALKTASKHQDSGTGDNPCPSTPMFFDPQHRALYVFPSPDCLYLCQDTCLKESRRGLEKATMVGRRSCLDLCSAVSWADDSAQPGLFQRRMGSLSELHRGSLCPV